MTDEDEVAELQAEARAARRQDRCVCDVGSWGTCPGPANCPNAPDEEDENDDEDADEA